jgi:hypothetical protein
MSDTATDAALRTVRFTCGCRHGTITRERRCPATLDPEHAALASGADGHSSEGADDLRRAEATWNATGLPKTRPLAAPAWFGDR